jgi:hypothetical protein
MKKRIVVSLLLFCIKFSCFAQRPILFFLQEKILIDNKILDEPLLFSHNPKSIVMLRITQLKLKGPSDSIGIRLGVTAVDTSSFQFFHFRSDKYFGFFYYKNHLVIVYGDDSPHLFFFRTNDKKSFDFMPLTPYVIDKDHPPIPIEATSSLYDYNNGKFKLVDVVPGFYK